MAFVHANRCSSVAACTVLFCLQPSSVETWHHQCVHAALFLPSAVSNHPMLVASSQSENGTAHHTCLNFAEYAAVTYDNVYVMATPCFWRLHPHELLVMQLLLYSLPTSSTTAQVPLHLPHSAANEPWSMLMTTLTAGTHSCWYCDEIAAVLVTPFESTINESPDVHVVYSVPNVSSLIPGKSVIHLPLVLSAHSTSAATILL